MRQLGRNTRQERTARFPRRFLRSRSLGILSAALPLALGALALPAAADTREAGTELVTVAHDGAQSNGHSNEETVSADGRVLAFESDAGNLVSDDSSRGNVFFRTSPGAALQRVSVPGEYTYRPSLSASGRYLSFESYSEKTLRYSAHVMDLKTKQIERLDPELPGSYIVSYGDLPISTDGRYVAFTARDSADPHTAYGCRVYVLDRATGASERVSRPSDGSKNFHQCDQISMSADGRKIAYQEGYTGPAEDDQGDILVYDRETDETVQADVTHDGAAAERSAVSPVLSPDGTKVLFDSMAGNMVPEADVNQNWNGFIRDLRTGALTRLDGASPTDLVITSGLSADNSKVLVGISDASLSVQGLYLRDLGTGEDTLVSPKLDGQPARVGEGTLSADASTVVFSTYQPGLVPGDTNNLMDVFVRTLR